MKTDLYKGMTQGGPSLPKWLQQRYIKDAEQPITVPVTARDVEGAKPQDGGLCAFGQCWHRVSGGELAYFYRNFAYIADPADENVAIRYRVPSSAFRNVIEPLDAGRPGDIKAGLYTLLPPSPTERRGAAVKRRAKRQAQGIPDGSTRRAHGLQKRPIMGRVYMASQQPTEAGAR